MKTESKIYFFSGIFVAGSEHNISAGFVMAEPRLLQGLMRALQWSAKGYRLVDWLGDSRRADHDMSCQAR